MESMVHVSQSTHAAPGFLILLMMFGIFVGLIVLAIKVLIFCKICSKAGYSWALGLLILVPIANIIIAFDVCIVNPTAGPVRNSTFVAWQPQSQLGDGSSNF